VHGLAQTLSAVEQVYAVGGKTAAQAQMECEAVNGVNGVTSSWSAH
jgi:hypothetical protein